MFPKKFKKLLEIQKEDIDNPDYIFLTYAVCAMEADSCGWGGWLIEAAYQKSDKKYPTSTGDKLLPTCYCDDCPKCGKPLFRTDACILLEPSQREISSLLPDMEYEKIPIQYEDE
jgi:hypothetical protein